MPLSSHVIVSIEHLLQFVFIEEEQIHTHEHDCAVGPAVTFTEQKKKKAVYLEV